MMTNRRKTLTGMLTAGVALLCGVTVAKRARAKPVEDMLAGAGPAGAASDSSIEAALRQDLERMGSRAYSDEGIAVFLACETVSGQAAPGPTELSATVAAQFRANAAAWQRIYPDAPDTDVSKVIEVIAERDFNRAASEGTL
jgi:hypothetical protein